MPQAAAIAVEPDAQASRGAAVGVARDAALVLPMARAALLQRTSGPDGAPLLTLFLRDKEVSWDDPRHFAFAEALAGGAEFTAAEAALAGGLGWDEAAPMLNALLAEGLLRPADEASAPADRHDNRPMPSPLPPAPMAAPRSWTEGASLMAELTGTALDTHYLEVVVPVFRTAHLYRDRDGRPIGEANVFPAAARSEVPTEWRGCPYAGNRYQPEKPMNMTALKAMRAQWRQMMGLLRPIREAYLRRFPAARAGWTVAHAERLAVCVLALPSYMLLRRDAPVANGDLHPALSNLFRVTDGLRMVMHHMLFVPLYEPMHAPGAPVTAEAILAYAERNFLFHSDHGVCAGPRFMVEDFLAVLLDGATPRSGFAAQADAELASAATLIEPAIDYALLGLQAFGAVFALWPAMARCYDRLHALLAAPGAVAVPGAAALAERFAGHFAALSHRSFLASEEWRAHRERVYDDMYAACAAGLAGSEPEPPLSRQLAGGGGGGAAWSGPGRSLAVAALARRFGAEGQALAEDCADAIGDFLLRAQRIVALAERVQARIARRLGRPAPGHELRLRHIDLHNALMGKDQRSVPFLPDELEALLGLAVDANAAGIIVRPLETRRAAARDSRHSPGTRPADHRA